MSQKVVFSIIETPLHPDFTGLYQSLNLENVQLGSMRKAISQLKKQKIKDGKKLKKIISNN